MSPALDRSGAGGMSVLFVSWNFPPRRGGAEELVRQLFMHLGRLGPVHLLTGHAPDVLADPPFVQRSPFRGLFGFFLWLLGRLPRELWSGRHDVVFSSGALFGSIVQLFTTLTRKPHAILLLGTDLTYPSPLYQLWLRATLRLAKLCLPISRHVANEALRRGVAEDRLSLLPPGIDPSMADLPVDPGVHRPSRAVLLFVGRIIPRKGLQPFVEHCLPRILERRDIELWVIGDEADASLAHEPGGLSALREQVSRQGLDDHVRFLGRAPDPTLRAAYRIARLLVLPAIAIPGDVEGFGIVFLEAALHGVPSVSARLGGIPDAVLDGETGLLAEPGDWPAFADLVLLLLEDDILYRRLSEQARDRAVGEFAWMGIASRCWKLLEGLRQ